MVFSDSHCHLVGDGTRPEQLTEVLEQARVKGVETIVNMTMSPGLKGSVHGFSGDLKELKDWLDLGFYISVGGKTERDDSNSSTELFKEYQKQRVKIQEEFEKQEQKRLQLQKQLMDLDQSRGNCINEEDNRLNEVSYNGKNNSSINNSSKYKIYKIFCYQLSFNYC